MSGACDATIHNVLMDSQIGSLLKGINVLSHVYAQCEACVPLYTTKGSDKMKGVGNAAGKIMIEQI